MRVILKGIDTQEMAFYFVLELVDRKLSVSMEKEPDGSYTVAAISLDDAYSRNDVAKVDVREEGDW